MPEPKLPMQSFGTCCRAPVSKEILRYNVGLDHDEDMLLTLARFYFESFAVPDTHSWMSGIDEAALHFGDDKGAIVAQRLLFALQSMRFARRSVFNFNSPTCEECSSIVTEHERRLMAAIQGVRLGWQSIVKTELMMLCEGNDTAIVEQSFVKLAAALPALPTAQKIHRAAGPPSEH